MLVAVRSVTLAFVLLAAASAWAADDDRPDWVADLSHDLVLEGEHWRIASPNGVIHVWRPRNYDEKTAGIVIYLHGDGDSSDTAFTNHALAKQFLTSGRNALFIVPEAPRDGDEETFWDSLGALLNAVHAATGVARPRGEVVVMGHSRAYRSIVMWLDDRRIGHVVLLDAMFSNEAEYTDWIDRSPGHEKKRLTLVSYTTRGKSEALIAKLEGAMKVTRIPPTFQALSKAQRQARVLYLRSQYGHMEIVTDGVVIPLVLQRTALVAVK